MAVTVAGAVLVEWAVTLRERAAAGGGLGKAGAVLREVTLLRTGERTEEDQHAKWILVGSAAAAIGLAALAQQHLTGLAFSVTDWPPTILGAAVMWAGILLRAWAIVTLGRFFRRDVQVADEQTVVESGPYAAIRHPAYAGNLLIFAGLGIALANWGSVAVLVVVPLIGLLPRIRVEDALLRARLGDPYGRYADRTSRLVPGIW